MEKLQLMSIGSNCANIGFLGKDRIRGPIDNVIATKGIMSSKLLFENNLYEAIKNAKPKITKNLTKTFPGDSDYKYEYNDFMFVHNNPTEEKFLKEFKRRIDTFNEFYKNIDKDDHYFVYSLGTNDVNKSTREVYDAFIFGLRYLEILNILDKTIIVGTRNENVKNYWDFYSKDIEKICNDKKIKYIEVVDNNVYHPDIPEKQFCSKLYSLLQNC